MFVGLGVRHSSWGLQTLQRQRCQALDCGRLLFWWPFTCHEVYLVPADSAFINQGEAEPLSLS